MDANPKRFDVPLIFRLRSKSEMYIDPPVAPTSNTLASSQPPNLFDLMDEMLARSPDDPADMSFICDRTLRYWLDVQCMRMGKELTREQGHEFYRDVEIEVCI